MIFKCASEISLRVSFDTESYIACVQIQPPKGCLAYKWGNNFRWPYLYSGDLNEVTVSICLTSERSLLVGSCQIEC
jgi:hypothetical protein